MISEEGKSPHLCAVLARCESIQLSADGAIDDFVQAFGESQDRTALTRQVSFMLATGRDLDPFVVLGRKMHVPGWVVVQAILSFRNALLLFMWIEGQDNHH